ncbi:hypothetical protein Vadar_010763 [Vaccinium darrowii]|uniref:Uncharacterized protein n=1 Tax=Vaccinium darrowii TaxID=229202 RepID=A0ACB7Y7B6_9ERIC|nr:hypothetical protein Vadar_010763 [Vaccinium darrowii]
MVAKWGKQVAVAAAREQVEKVAVPVEALWYSEVDDHLDLDLATLECDSSGSLPVSIICYSFWPAASHELLNPWIGKEPFVFSL